MRKYIMGIDSPSHMQEIASVPFNTAHSRGLAEILIL